MKKVEQKPHYLVGVGASAGGLEALTQLVSKLHKKLNCSIVIIQHLSPNYRSMMVELLARETTLNVVEADNGTSPKLGYIYIAPPKWDLIVKDGLLQLVEPVASISPKPSVNRFFTSLAEEKEEYAISVVLSGTGTDGAVGSRAIKANGGITFAQTPETAKYDGMPMSSINTGVIDRVFSPAQIAEEISSLVNMDPASVEQYNDESESEQLRRLFRIVRKQTKIDFSGYKRTTLWRRIHRRMATNRLKKFDDYLNIIQTTPKESEALSKDILISVTAFYRDPEVFRLLEVEMRRRLAEKKLGDEIRIWVPGCATGEEAYTIAIMLHQILGNEFSQYQIQIFATDIDLAALETARKAVYPATALEGLDQTLIDRYFIKQDDQFQLTKELRDVIVFARQDLILDPPFLRLDLISCRNLLIYFDNILQSKVLQVMNYALKNEGLLLLGRSESVSQNDKAFVTINSTGKLFSSVSQVEYINKEREEIFTISRPDRAELHKPPTQDFDHVFKELVETHYLPPSVLVDEKYRIIKVEGDVSPFIRFGTTKPDLDITKLLSADMGAEVLSLLLNAAKKSKTVKGRRRRLHPHDKGLTQIVIHPGKDDVMHEQFFLVSFVFIPQPRKVKSESTGLSQKALEDELISTKEHLQTITEELETSNEELQALNEEVQASNEELQASNEELQASNEELQATNEELVTVNEEVMAKSAELTAINADFASVHNSLDFPVVVLDTNLHLTRVNNSCRDQFIRLLPPLGHSIKDLVFDESTVTIEQIRKVQSSAHRITTAVKMSGREYQLHLTPCADQLGQERGVIISLIDQHDLILSEREASKNKNFLMSVMNNSVSMVSVKDLSGRYQFANRAFLRRFELSEVEGKTDSMLFPEEVATLFRQHDLKVLETLDSQVQEESFFWKNSELLLETVRFPLLDADGIAHAICCQTMDLTLKKASRDKLRLTGLVFERAAEGIMVTDTEKRIISVNDAFTRVTGYTYEEVKDKTPAVLSSGKHDQTFYKNMWQKINSDGWWQGEIWNKRKNGQIYPEWLSVSEVRDENHQLMNYLGIFSDITVIKDSQSHVEFLATHDELTSLPNRTLLNDRLKHAIKRAERSESGLFVIFCDVDNFKVINDTLGHKMGDMLLIEAAARLKQAIRDQDTLARVGGDEFVILIEDVDVKLVEQVAHRILLEVAEAFSIQKHDFYVTLSLGISKYPEDGQDSDALLKNADTAMYRSKDKGKNQYNFFTEQMRYESQQRLLIEMGMRLALQSNEFELFYQPIINCKEQKIVSTEVLLRWHSKDFPAIGPAKFIPIAEKTGLIKQIDTWVIEHALAERREQLDLGIDLPPICINISGSSLNTEGLVSCIESYLEKYRIVGSDITIEVTENILIQSFETSSKVLQELRGLGISIAIDDFGTGYSSMQYLQQLPIDKLKVDASFVRDLEKDNGDCAIAKAIINMSGALDIKTIAEGIETEKQCEILKSLGCDFGQGYYFYRPMPMQKLLETLRG